MTKEFRCPHLQPNGTCLGPVDARQTKGDQQEIVRTFVYPKYADVHDLLPFADPPTGYMTCSVRKRPDLQALCSPNQTDKTS